jgi:hypothetical protein
MVGVQFGVADVYGKISRAINVWILGLTGSVDVRERTDCVPVKLASQRECHKEEREVGWSEARALESVG